MCCFFYPFINHLLGVLTVWFVERKHIVYLAWICYPPSELTALRSWIDMANFMFLTLDKDGNLKFVNKKTVQTLEAESEEELVGMNWFDNFVPEAERRQVRKVFKKKHEFEIRIC